MEVGGTNLHFDSATYQDVLFEYIDAATPERLRLILREVYDEVPQATEPLMFKLVAGVKKDRTNPLFSGYGLAEVGGSSNAQTGDHVLSSPQDGTHHACNPALHPPSLKRAPEPHIDTCVPCKRDFNTQRNTPVACTFHHGTLEIDHGASVRDDCDGDGERDISEFREQYPQAVGRSCCGARADGAGCRKDIHRSDGTKRSRIG
ncbi:hypothetical protein BKA63DRAFT_118318 [Paraphoma chrysanthemicola]|nr:hypothetical protein BKA63DRAFT_118318 [Paraphoma chrysanthemicola]